MSEHAGEKTEKPTTRRLEEAVRKGQFSHSADLQTFFVMGGALMALRMTDTIFRNKLMPLFSYLFANLHKTEVSASNLQQQALLGAAWLGGCVGPVIITAAGAGWLAGGMQARFQTASEALRWDWERLNPMAGFGRIFSKQGLVQLLFSLGKLGVIGLLAWGTLKGVSENPIFYTSLGAADISRFVAETAFSLGSRLVIAMMFVAGVDYAYQFWKTNQDLMMTREEVKEEMKNSEGDPQMKARLRRRRKQKTQQQMLAEVPTADVVITNPTRLAIALRYDRKNMKAPTVVAKGSRLNAKKIRELAEKNHVPIMENKPLARMMFKHCRVGGEIPAELYAAVAEILAWVYRVNRYRYYSEQNRA